MAGSSPSIMLPEPGLSVPGLLISLLDWLFSAALSGLRAPAVPTWYLFTFLSKGKMTFPFPLFLTTSKDYICWLDLVYTSELITVTRRMECANPSILYMFIPMMEDRCVHFQIV